MLAFSSESFPLNYILEFEYLERIGLQKHKRESYLEPKNPTRTKKGGFFLCAYEGICTRAPKYSI